MTPARVFTVVNVQRRRLTESGYCVLFLYKTVIINVKYRIYFRVGYLLARIELRPKDVKSVKYRILCRHNTWGL